MKRLLYIAHRVPYPPDKGERVRAYQQLKALAQLLDMPLSGTKARLRARLIAWRKLRETIAHYTAPEQMTTRYDMKALKAMASVSGSWRSGSKRQVATGLLNWRDKSRKRGKDNLKAAMKRFREGA